MLFTKDTAEADFTAGTLIPIDKPLTWTSFDVVNKLRYALKKFDRKIKVGHAGTLDPLATGLLIIATGKMTRQIDSVQGLDKTYTGTLKLGATTPCFDAELPEDAQFDISGIKTEDLYAAAKKLNGNIAQVPPSYSAIKQDGKTAYVSARKGKEFKLEPRSVTIHHFELTHIHLPFVDFSISCSKGTYIRAIARDFGQILNNGAYLTALRRTAIGNYTIDEAWKLEDLITFIDQIEKPNAGTPGT